MNEITVFQGHICVHNFTLIIFSVFQWEFPQSLKLDKENVEKLS